MPDESDIKVIEAGYLRWMLRANPFAYLSSESLEEVKEVHVDTDVDDRLAELLQGVVRGEDKRVIFLVGEFGTGKTHRLRLIGEVLEEASTFYVKIDVDDYASSIYRIANVVKNTIPFKVIKRKLPEDPDILLSMIRDELNNYEVSVLLLDEVENVVVFGTRKDAELFSKAISKLFQELREGRAIVIGCIPPAYDIMKRLIEVPHDKVEMRKL
ncbi:MAG: ATP-binding protein, partial [Candidatus Korarchaeum sp.]|nr:ATP-binding protein [Candidatus Korarchaeum sp.]